MVNAALTTLILSRETPAVYIGSHGLSLHPWAERSC
jgi:hypothetical protein